MLHCMYCMHETASDFLLSERDAFVHCGCGYTYRANDCCLPYRRACVAQFKQRALLSRETHAVDMYVFARMVILERWLGMHATVTTPR